MHTSSKAKVRNDQYISYVRFWHGYCFNNEVLNGPQTYIHSLYAHLRSKAEIWDSTTAGSFRGHMVF